MNYAKNPINIICNYLIERYQYVQIEEKRSTLLPLCFGVPQGSILGPVLFNLYAAELADRTYSTTIQYADDTTLHRHCKISKLHECAVAIQKMWKSCNLGHNKIIGYSTVTNFSLFYFPRHD